MGTPKTYQSHLAFSNRVNNTISTQTDPPKSTISHFSIFVTLIRLSDAARIKAREIGQRQAMLALV